MRVLLREQQKGERLGEEQGVQSVKAQGTKLASEWQLGLARQGN
jgi:hypothetical protein